MIGNLLEEVAFIECLPYDTGTAVRTGKTMDARGYNSIVFACHIHSVAGSGSSNIWLEHDTDLNFGSPETVMQSGIGYLSTSAGGVLKIEIYRPLKPFLRLIFGKDGTNATSESAICIFHNSKTLPVKQEAGTYKLLLRPGDGSPI